MVPFLKSGEQAYDPVDTSIPVDDSDFSPDYSQKESSHKKRLLAPDLYIPLMALMTYILIACFTRGVDEEFKPEQISKYTFNCLIFSLLEVLLYKFVLVIGRVNSLTFLDLIAFLNYKFVGLCFIMLIDGAIGGIFSLFIRLYFSISFVYYMFAELQLHAYRFDTSQLGVNNLKSETVVYLLSGIQFVTMWILVWATTGSLF